MNDEPTPIEQKHDEQAAQDAALLQSLSPPAQPEPEKLWACPYCAKTFTDHRRRMGHVRMMHPQMPIPRRSPEEVRAAKLAENRRRREEYWARGLTSAGTKRKIGFRKSPQQQRVKSGTSRMTPRERYVYYRDRNRALGLNAKGQPFKVSVNAAKNIQHAQKMRRQRERREQERLNGAAPQAQTETQPQDNLGDSARAIIMAAQVLRSVSIGMKL